MSSPKYESLRVVKKLLSDKHYQALRSLPAVNSLLQAPELQGLIKEARFELISRISSKVLAEERQKITEAAVPQATTTTEILAKITDKYHKLAVPHLHSVINGTGVILHTNLGRAKLSTEALEAVQNSALNYSNLEYNIIEGKRGTRFAHVEELLIELTGAEAATVVNNNAAAVILILQEMAQGKEVIVSRGQLVEIGGSFRVSEIMAQSGAQLVEVGTTNKTHEFDYERAITPNTALLMKVHTSNYKMIGFTKEVPLDELVQIGALHQLPVYEDLGSGVLYDLKKHGIGEEPTVQEAIKAGADLVSFSGDKLLGGPQTGIIVGKKQLIERIKKNQLARALRVDKMTLAALEATLRHYLLNEAPAKIPTLRMLLMNSQTLEEKASKLYDLLKDYDQQAELRIIDGFSEVGGGSMPDVQLPTKLIAIKPHSLDINRFESAMRLPPSSIIGRIVADKYLLDVRTIEVEQFTLIKEKIDSVL